LREEVNPQAPVKASLSAARRLESALRGLNDPPAVFLAQVGEIIVHLEEELEALGVDSQGEAGSMREI
jgi:hypothetical protein